jgi:hypothetical protein
MITKKHQLLAGSIISGLSMLIGGCAFEMDTAMEMDFEPSESNAINWANHNNNTPHGDAELLAAKVLQSGGKPQKSGNRSAWLMNDNPPFAIVAVDEKSSKDDEMISRTLYQFQEDNVIATSYPQFIEGVETEEGNNKRQQYASEIAMQAKQGVTPNRPVLYEGKYAYSPRYDGACKVVVTEYNTSRKVIGTYAIDVCREVKK